MKQRPGRTSKIQLGKSVLTLQTEIRGQPPQVVTVVDVAGRVVQTEINAIPSEVIDRGEQALLDYSCRAHGRVEVKVREALDRKLQSKRSREPAAEQGVQGTESNETAAWLFVAAVDAYTRDDLHACEDLLLAVATLLPNDERVDSCVACVQDLIGAAGSQGPRSR